jgi:hypothetical protein
MAGATSKLGLPYPSLSDAPNGPANIQSLASAIDALGVIGGKRQTSAGAAINTVETIVIDTQTIAMPASSVFLIEFDLSFTTTVAATDVNMRIRLTSVSGTVVAGPIVYPGPYTTQGNSGRLAVVYKTTTAELNYFAGTIVRQAGTGNITAVTPTSLIVTNLGPNTLLGDY